MRKATATTPKHADKCGILAKISESDNTHLERTSSRHMPAPHVSISSTLPTCFFRAKKTFGIKDNATAPNPKSEKNFIIHLIS